MGATPSHEDNVVGDDPEEESDEDDGVLKMQKGRSRVSSFLFLFLLCTTARTYPMFCIYLHTWVLYNYIAY